MIRRDRHESSRGFRRGGKTREDDSREGQRGESMKKDGMLALEKKGLCENVAVEDRP